MKVCHETSATRAKNLIARVFIVGFVLLHSNPVAWAADFVRTAEPEKLEFFENKVRPLLVEHCYSCHSAEAEAKGKLKAGLRMDSLEGLKNGGDSGPAVTPGDPAKSLIVEAVNYRNEDMAMPPKAKLNDAQIQILTEWVQMGAPWPGGAAAVAGSHGDEPYDWEKFRTGHWSFRPIVKSAPPEVKEAAWVKSDFDRFVLARLEAAGLKPNIQAERNLLIRRAFLDLTGLPPSPEQVAAFLADESPAAFANVVDSLLASVHYGERWARHWLDVARYCDGHGGNGDSEPLPNAWRYRDWVVAALNADMPYDQFVVRQIAGDELRDNPDHVATGFFFVGPTYADDGGDPEAKALYEAETLSDRVDTFSRAFLGLTAACARCHDHKFDPITTKDYYAIAGIFRNTGYGEYPISPKAEVDAYHAAQAAIHQQDKSVNEFVKAAAERLKKTPDDVEATLEEEPKRELVAMRVRLEELRKSAPPRYEFAHRLYEKGSADMPVALRGDLRKPGEIVPRRFLEIIAGQESPRFTKGSGRMELARSVVAANNPLTARVIVNRVWGWHFGEPLARTPSNFGTLGEKPTHPELLDWLAADFMEHGWSLKRLHRQILLSATWQMSSKFDKEKFTKDGDNRLLWRMNPRKLEAEAWRDSLLAVTGELERTTGGPSSDAIWNSKRRTLYIKISRSGDVFESDDFLRLFDLPSPAATSEKRVTTNVPQQYLFMMNSAFMKARAEALGNWMRELPGELPQKLQAAYQRLYSRTPEPSEIDLGAQWLGTNPEPQRWHHYAQVLLSAHELIQIQ
ncbi:MAG: PSD1 and planctomycete cytochrome C domain-containing protein [Verrucomicrobia bacterium]|nr:PSD1 and planctomycete cytochrome C domain-containing protein [Verrucomicrobiota bacterium]